MTDEQQARILENLSAVSVRVGHLADNADPDIAVTARLIRHNLDDLAEAFRYVARQQEPALSERLAQRWTTATVATIEPDPEDLELVPDPDEGEEPNAVAAWVPGFGVMGL